jgi:adenosylmethionine-8-amino-7-oxononanoate transaminase/dethiobiotin synthase
MGVIAITGTDTGVGKTVVTAAIASYLRSIGKNVCAVKPYCTGTPKGSIPEDIELLAKACLKEPNELFCYSLEAPLSPLAASRLEGRTLFLEAAVSFVKHKIRNYEHLVIEGVGGILVPLDDVHTFADLVYQLDVPLIVVARPTLGTINHTLLTIELARLKGIRILGFCFSEAIPNTLADAADNASIISQFSGVRFLGTLQHVDKVDDIQLAEASQKFLDMRHILDTLESDTKPKEPTTAELDKRYVWHPFTPMSEWLESEPLSIDRGYGAKVYDEHGREYIDSNASLWATIHGHRHPKITQAIHAQLDKIAHSTLLGLTHRNAALLAEKLVELTPEKLTRVFYSDSGATAVEVGLRIAVEYWANIGQPQRRLFVTLEEAYHGDTIGAVSLGRITTFHSRLSHILFPVIKIKPPYLYQREYGLPEHKAVNRSLADIRRAIEENRESVAGIFIEPKVQAAAGIWIQPEGFLKGVEGICREFGLLLICDEVATGFGKTGYLFACNCEDIAPDIMALAKGLTAGYLPLAATLVTEPIFNAFLGRPEEGKTFYYGHTFTGNPLGSAAAIASLQLLEDSKIIEHVREAAAHMHNMLEQFKEHKNVLEVRQQGIMVGIELVANKSTKEPFAPGQRVGHRVSMQCRNYGVIARPLGDTLVIMPPLNITRQEIDIVINAFYRSIRDILG